MRLRSLLPAPAALAASAATALLLCAAPARADCTIPDYAAAADPRLAGAPPCEEIERFSIQTPRGPRQVRMIRDRLLPGDWVEPVALTRTAIARAAETLRALGRGTVPDLLVLLTGLQPAETPPDPGDAEAVEADRLSFKEGVADGRSGEECLLVVYPGNTRESEFGFVVAHEFFHCVQYAMAAAQMNARGDGRPDLWWVEGMAEWFANRAHPGSDASARYLARFDRRTPDSPIVEADYDGFVFWSWYAREWGGAAVLDYLPRAPDGGREAQLGAAATIVAEDRWQRFVEDYLDRALRYPDARRLPVSPEPGETVLFTETTSRTLEAPQLALFRADLVFTCGRWTLETEDRAGSFKVRDPGEPGAWQELPETLEIEPGRERRFRLGGIGPHDRGFRVTLRATRDEESRGGCLCGRFSERQEVARDSCLVGTWALASGGGHAWLDRNLKRIQRESGTWASYQSSVSTEAGRELTIGADGRYHYGLNEVERSEEAFTEKGDRYASRIRGGSGGVGFWSTREGMLNVCALSEGSGAVAEIDIKGEVMTLDLPGYLSDHLYSGGYHYSCGGGELQLRHIAIPGAPEPMEWVYRRVE